ICAGEVPPVALRCPRCGTPVAPGIEQVPASWEPGQAEDWSPPPRMAPPPAGTLPGPVPAAGRAPADQGPVRRDWPGALRCAGLAILAAYVPAAGLAALLVPAGSPPPVRWLLAPAALIAVALGGQWQATVPDLEGAGPGGAFGYQVHAFPL